MCLLGSRLAPLQAATVPTFLPGGVRLVVEERPETETVAIRIVMGMGDLDDPPGRRGVGDLHARLLTKGTQSRTATELARAAEALGGRLFCYSALQHTTCGMDAPAESLAPAFELLAEVVRAPRFDAADLAKEKALRIGELRSSRDDPSNLVWDETVRALFPDHTLRRTTRLEPAEVEAVTLDDVRTFHGRALSPENMAVMAVGHCSTSELERLAATAFENLAGQPVKATSFARSRVQPPPPLPVDVHRRVHARTTQAQILAALPTPGVPDDDLPSYAVLRFVLGGFEERLSAEIREKRGYAYWLSLTGVTLPDAGWFGVYTGARKSHLDEIEGIVRQELRRIVEAPISTEELARAKQYLKTAEARIDGTNAGRVSALTSAMVDGRPLRSYEERIARLDSVTPAQVQALARRLFEGKHLAVVTMR